MPKAWARVLGLALCGVLLGGALTWMGRTLGSPEPGEPNVVQATATPRPRAESTQAESTQAARTQSENSASPLSSPAATTESDVYPPLVSRELVATDLLSHSAGGLPVDHPVTGVALAADGQIVAFSTRARNLDIHRDGVQGEGLQSQGLPSSAIQSDYEQVYVLDRTANRLELITLGIDGAPGNGWSSAPALSPDGRYVAFYSWASNLVQGDTNAVQDAFLYDRRTGAMARVSVAWDGRQGNDRSGDSRAVVRPTLSADGRYVAFHSAATNLVETTVSGVQVYLHDRQTGATSLLSAAEDGAPGDGDSIQPVLSADGRFVAFQSRAGNLGAADAGATSGARPAWQVWWLDRLTGARLLVSHDVNNAPGNDDSTWPALSADGRRIAFQSGATNLALTQEAVNHNRVQDIFLYDVTARALRRVSVSGMGVPGNRDSTMPALSLDGRYVAFASAASNLVSGDVNERADIFLHDVAMHHTSRVSVGVVERWLGVEANAAAWGPPALTADGTQVAFLSQATNLLPPLQQGSNSRALATQAYLHTRRAPAAYVAVGRTLDVNRRPIAGAVIRAGPHRAESDAEGRYRLPALVAGTYTLVVQHPRYSFAPPRLITSVLRDVQNLDFTGYAAVDQAQAFLDLPIAYDGTISTFLQALHDTAEGGLVDAWFDHAYPDYSKTGSILLWDGRLRDLALYNEELGCYQQRCYDGHDGVDFPFREHLVDPALGPYAIPILPAAPGRVVHVVEGCARADRWCNGGYGNEVIVYHDNGYLTRYSHLERVDTRLHAYVTRAAPLGIMGASGNSYGIHLHFGVHRDNGNATWDGDRVDLPVDPFGWAGSEPDPWVAQRGGPVSRRLWLHYPNTEAVLVGSMGGVLRDVAGNIQVTLPAGAFAGQARLELAPAAPEGPIPSGTRSVGRAFWLRVLDWLGPDAGPARGVWTFDEPLAVNIDLDELNLGHLDLDGLTLYRWDAARQNWASAPTVWAGDSQVTAQIDATGNFDLAAPLLCPQDMWEPDEGYFAAAPLERNGGVMRRLFHSAQDQDWFRLEMSAGRTLTAVVDELGAGVLPELTLYDMDGVTELARQSLEPHGQTLQLTWTPTETGTETGTAYLRLRPTSASATGCAAVYAIRVQVEP